MVGGMYQDIAPETRRRVAAMYQAGERLKAITEETNLSRPTIYWILRTEGIVPDRKPRVDSLSMKELLEALRLADQEIGRLTADLERLRQQQQTT